jgi:ATP synthase protein I
MLGPVPLERQRCPTEPEAQDNLSKPARFFRAASFASLGLEMGICIAVGAGIGYLLDAKLGTRPWLLLVFILFGVAAGFKGMIAAARRARPDMTASNQRKDKDDDGSERARPD